MASTRRPRWKDLGWLVAVTAAAVIGVVSLTLQTRQASHDADRATRISIEVKQQTAAVKKQQAALRAVRNEQIKNLHAVDVRSCASEHALDLVVQQLLDRTINQIEAEKLPDLTPKQTKRIDELNAESVLSLQQGLDQARHADCRSVPPIPAIGSHP